MGNRSSGLLFSAFLILGIIIAMQFRAVMKTESYAKSDTASKIQQLITVIDKEKALGKELENKINQELKRGTELETAFIQQQKDKRLELLYEELQDVMLKAGLTDVSGPGLIITLDDALVRPNVEIGSLVIHDSDIKELINDLKAAGAQAISINGERLLATSEQICAGPTIRINWRKYTVPYVIHVIGNPDRLNQSLKNSKRLAYMKRDGIRIDIRTAKNVVIPGFKSGGREIDEFINMLEVAQHETG